MNTSNRCTHVRWWTFHLLFSRSRLARCLFCSSVSVVCVLLSRTAERHNKASTIKSFRVFHFNIHIFLHSLFHFNYFHFTFSIFNLFLLYFSGLCACKNPWIQTRKRAVYVAGATPSWHRQSPSAECTRMNTKMLMNLKQFVKNLDCSTDAIFFFLKFEERKCFSFFPEISIQSNLFWSIFRSLSTTIFNKYYWSIS